MPSLRSAFSNPFFLHVISTGLFIRHIFSSFFLHVISTGRFIGLTFSAPFFHTLSRPAFSSDFHFQFLFSTSSTPTIVLTPSPQVSFHCTPVLVRFIGC